MSEGRYCSDRMPKLCMPCSFASDLKKTMSNVIHKSINMQSRQSLNNDYGSVRSALASRLPMLEELQSNIEQANTVAASADEQEPMEDTEMNEVEVEDVEVEDVEVDSSAEEGEEESPVPSVHIPAKDNNRYIGKDLDALLAMVDLSQSEMVYLKPGGMRGMIAGWLRKLKRTLKLLRRKNVVMAGDVDEEDAARIKALSASGNTILEELDKKIAAEEAKLKENSKDKVFESGTPLDVIEQGQAYLENQMEYFKGDEKREQLSRVIQENVVKILEKDTKLMSMGEVLVFLRQASLQLNFMKEQWGQLELFFDTISTVFKRSKQSVRMAKNYYVELKIEKTDRPNMINTFRDYLKQNALDALAYSTYTKT